MAKLAIISDEGRILIQIHLEDRVLLESLTKCMTKEEFVAGKKPEGQMKPCQNSVCCFYDVSKEDNCGQRESF